MVWRRFFALVFLFSATPASARVFSFQDNWVAAYFRGTAGNSTVSDSSYAKTSGDLTTFDGTEANYNFSGEIGFSFLLNDNLGLRVGIEGVQTSSLEVVGNSTALGTKHMDIGSRVSSFNTNVAMEYNFRDMGFFRYFFFLGGGYSQMKVSNEYVLSGLGKADYGATQNEFTEAWYANGISYFGGFGIETFMLDNVTFNIEAGYRTLAVSEMYHQDSQDVIRGSGLLTVQKGATVTDNSGNAVDMSLSGAFIGLMFRFYIPPLD